MYEEKGREQNKFTEWCKEVGIGVTVDVKFGHSKGFKRDALPIFAKCKLEGDRLIMENENCLSRDNLQLVDLPPVDFIEVDGDTEKPTHIIESFNNRGGRVLFSNYNIKPNEDGLIEVMGLITLQDIEIF